MASSSAPPESGSAPTPSSTNSPLRFAPLASQVSPSFWTTLAAYKVDRAQLSQEAIPLDAQYTLGRTVRDRTTSELVHLSANVTLDASSLDQIHQTAGPSQTSSAPQTSGGGSGEARIPMRGTLTNYNTIEEFKKADKAQILNQAAQDLLTAMVQAEDPLAHLHTFLCLSFADLKKYKFVHWFAFPTLLANPPWQVDPTGWQRATEVWSSEGVQAIDDGLRQGSRTTDRGFFLVHADGTVGQVMDFDHFFATTPEDQRTVGFIDPSAQPDTPGWPLRNLLALLAVRFHVRRIRVLCWRDELGSSSPAENSIVSTVFMPAIASDGNARISHGEGTLPFSASSESPTQPVAVGWERNTTGKLAPKMADLGPLMDPRRLADQAVDLNLKLMRWRILPEIDLDRIASTRCLLLGAGTLGCYVARTLMGWGVKTITLVDSSTVSFSNPVRQPLFEFADCLQGGKPKAQCAAEALQRIYPGVQVQGHQLNIPMPGHPIPSAQVAQVEKDVAQLEELVEQHDAIYLLMDSRESRWLPTVLGAAKGKMVFNTALGFDTYLAMRHGASPQQHQAAAAADTVRLGCYFCNDVVAPTDSLTDRTLDQMCTVTRPGLASIAAASTVEMMVSLLHHPQGILAPPAIAAPAASQGENVPDKSASILGRLPHQLRGSLFNFQTMLIHGPAYDRCTACSPTVLEVYSQRGFAMVQQACNEDAYLRSLTGLDQLYDATDDIEVEWDEEEGEGEEGDGELL